MTISIVKKSHADFHSSFELIENPLFEYKLEIACNETLLTIAFVNLLKNACLYSIDKKAIIQINHPNNDQLIVSIKNNGNVLNNEEQEILFQAFMRGKNSLNKPGSGLGLRIVQRIFKYHKAQLNYSVNENNLNKFEIIFVL